MHDPQPLVWMAFAVGSWEILRRVFRWADDRIDRRRYQRWAAAFDDPEYRQARRIDHLHVIDGGLHDEVVRRRHRTPSP